MKGIPGTGQGSRARHPHTDKDGLVSLARDIQNKVPVSTVLVHPTTYAFAVYQGDAAVVDGPSSLNAYHTVPETLQLGILPGQTAGIQPRVEASFAGLQPAGFMCATPKAPASRTWPT